MFSRLPLTVSATLALTFVASCGSTPETHQQAPISPSVEGQDGPLEPAIDEPAPAADPMSNADGEQGTELSEEPAVDPFAPAPWTGAFLDTAVMLGNSYRIEGPKGLLDHVVASSDDAFYERTARTTPKGFMQIIRRLSPEVPEIRVQLDAWTIAAFDRVVILERIDDGPVRLIANGDVLWRNPNGRIGQGQRLEFTGHIGDMTPVLPPDDAGVKGASDPRPAPDAPTTDTPSTDTPSNDTSIPGETPANHTVDTDADSETEAPTGGAASDGADAPNAAPGDR